MPAAARVLGLLRGLPILHAQREAQIERRPCPRPEFAVGNPSDADEFLDLLSRPTGMTNRPPILSCSFRIWEFWAAGGDDDAVIGRMIRPALRPIAVHHMDVVVTKISQQGSGLLGELTDPLDGINVAAIWDRRRPRSLNPFRFRAPFRRRSGPALRS